jgi:hypothetical protein
MNDLKVFRWTGAFGVAASVLVLVEFPLYVSRGPTPLLEDTTRYADFMSRNSGNVLTCVVLDMLIFVGILVFLAGFRHLIRQARPDYEWLATLVFGVGLVYTTLTLVGDSVMGGQALDTVGGKADATAIRALADAQFLMFGSVALMLLALLLASAGSAILATRALPRWTGWVACAGAIVTLAFVPTIYAGTDMNGFYTATGWGPYVATFPTLIWIMIVGISMIRKREATAPTSVLPAPVM